MLSCHVRQMQNYTPYCLATLQTQDAVTRRQWECFQSIVSSCAELARREERFAEKASSASVRAKPAEAGEKPEADGRSRRPSEARGKKETSSAAAPAQKSEDSRPSREHRQKDRDTALRKERDYGTADRSRHVQSAAQKDEASGQLTNQEQPAQNGKVSEGKQVEKDAEPKAKPGARSSQKSAAPAAEPAHKLASQPEEKAEKPAVELDSLRERALSSRRPTSKQEESADSAGRV